MIHTLRRDAIRLPALAGVLPTALPLARRQLQHEPSRVCSDTLDDIVQINERNDLQVAAKGVTVMFEGRNPFPAAFALRAVYICCRRRSSHDMHGASVAKRECLCSFSQMSRAVENQFESELLHREESPGAG